MKKLVVFTDGFDSSLFNKLKLDSPFQLLDTPKIEKEELEKILPQVHCLVVRSKTIVNQDLLNKAPNLELVIRAGEGMDNIDLLACEKRKITALNTPGANGESAAELAISLIFATLRGVTKADSWIQQGIWEKNKLTGYELSKKKLGIIGFGRIGQMVSKKLSGFDLEQYFFDPTVSAENVKDNKFIKKIDQLENIFSLCNIITIHTPLVPETKNLITYDLIKKMPKPSFLINAARGGIINKDDLLKSLEEKLLTGVGLDVFETEPIEGNSPFKNRDNVVLTPHIGASTHEAQYRIGLMVIDILQEKLTHKGV